MLIKRTTPVETFYDSYVAEVTVEAFKADHNSYLTVGPFKRVQHRENLEHLLHTLETVQTDGNTENYHWVMGFSPWFNPKITTFEELEKYYSCSAADFHSEEEHEEVFRLSRGFAKEWPMEPNNSDGYYQTLADYRVFYYDFNGNKFNTEVTL